MRQMTILGPLALGYVLAAGCALRVPERNERLGQERQASVAIETIGDGGSGGADECPIPEDDTCSEAEACEEDCCDLEVEADDEFVDDTAEWAPCADGACECEQTADVGEGGGSSCEDTETIEVPVGDGPPPDGCRTEVIEGIVRQCCREGYSAFKNCTSFACQFHNLCRLQGVGCRTISISCNDAQGKSAHALNVALIANKGWCVVEPQTGTIYEPCSADPNQIAQSVLCRAMGRAADCTTCTLKKVCDKPVLPNTNTARCRQSTSDRTACIQCCDNDWWYQYCKKHGIRGCNEWRTACYCECRGLPWP